MADILDTEKTEFPNPSQDAIDALKAKYHTLYSWELEDLGEFVWRYPSAAIWRKFVDETHENKDPRSETLIELLRGTIVYPEEPVLSKTLAKYPLIVGQLAQKVQLTCAAKQKKEPRKL